MKGHATTHAENKTRLARVEGQVRAVGRMIDDGEYCIDIVTQIQAARSALQSVSKIILEKHLKHCVAAALEAHDEADIDQRITQIYANLHYLKRSTEITQARIQLVCNLE